jgi:hypothetical protein
LADPDDWIDARLARETGHDKLAVLAFWVKPDDR